MGLTEDFAEEVAVGVETGSVVGKADSKMVKADWVEEG
jgi:hypothetical protein